jgi:hypothetical protein
MVQECIAALTHAQQHSQHLPPPSTQLQLCLHLGTLSVPCSTLLRLTSEPLLLLRCLPELLERPPAPDRCFSSSGRGTLLLAYSTARCRALGSLGLARAGAAAARRTALADLMRLLSSRTRSFASRCRHSEAHQHTQR